MGVWSLLQYFEKYSGDSVKYVSTLDTDVVGGFDVVYVDANSVLHGADGDVRRLVTLMRILKPQRAFILAADESTDVKTDGQAKPGKYLTACRYFIAAAEYIRGGKFRESATGDITDQEDYTSPLMLPQAEPNPFLKHALADIGPECIIATVARDVKGTADAKIAALAQSLTGASANCTHCIVSRDNDLVLTALSAWNPQEGATPLPPPPSVLTWPSQAWDQDGLQLLDTATALPALFGEEAATPHQGRDFSLLALLTLGCDDVSGVFGGVHYTHLHSLARKYAELFPGGTPHIVTTRAGPAKESLLYPSINRSSLVKLLKKFGAGRTGDEVTAQGTVPKKANPAYASRRWCTALWASVAAMLCGRTPRPGERFTQQTSANMVLNYLESAATREEAEGILSGSTFITADGAGNGSKVNPHNRMVLEIFSTEGDNRHLHGQGEVVDAAKLPTRNQKCEGLPPINSQKFDLFKVRLFADDVVRPFLRGRLALRSPRRTPKMSARVGPAPRLFKGFATGAGRQGPGAPAPAATQAPRATSDQIRTSMWTAMGMGTTGGDEGQQAKLILKGLSAEKKEQRQQRKVLKRKRDPEGGEKAPKKTRRSAEAAATAERKATRKAKARAIAKHRMKPKNTASKK